MKDLVALIPRGEQALRRAPRFRRIVLPELLDDDLVQSDVKTGIDLFTVDDHDFFVALECVGEIRMFGFDQHATLVSIAGVEQRQIDGAEESAAVRGGKGAASLLVRWWANQMLRGPSLAEELPFPGMARPLAAIGLGERGFDGAHARPLHLGRGEPVLEVDRSRHTDNLEPSPETAGDFVELVALEDLARGDAFGEPGELGQSEAQSLLVGSPTQTSVVDIGRRKKADCLRGNLAVTCAHELVEAVDKNVFRRKDEGRLARRKPNLRDFFARRREACGGFDEDIVLGIDPVSALTVQPERRKSLIDGRPMRQVEIDVSGRIGTASPELDRDAADDDRPKAQLAYHLVDDGRDCELALGLVVEPEYSFELLAPRDHERMLGERSAIDVESGLRAGQCGTPVLSGLVV